MQFKYYVLNYDFNKKKVVFFNIFNNIYVQERAEKEVKKYLRNPSKYKKNYMDYEKQETVTIYGFNALCNEIDSIIKWQEWGRTEYEISVSDASMYEINDIVRDIDKYKTLEELKTELLSINKVNPKLEKFDCYLQCFHNIPTITREIIYQYKQQLKNDN